jgi:hypothetical protein
MADPRERLGWRRYGPGRAQAERTVLGLTPVVLKDYRLTSFMVRLSDGFRKPSGLLSFRTGLRFTRSASAVCSKRPPHRHAA